MKTKEERATQYAEKIIGFIPDDDEKVAYADYLIVRNAYLMGATEQEDAMHAIVEENVLRAVAKQRAIDEANPSDKMIMRILNAIGYEEESWVQFVREHIKTMEE